MRLIMIRHPKTEANERKLVYGRTDALYSEVGKATIPGIVEALHDVKIDRMYSSPLTRTRLLAEEIAVDHGIGLNEIFMDNRILEMNFGKFENKTIAELEAEYPEEFQAYRQDFNDCVVPGGESFRRVYERTVEFLKEIYLRHEAGRSDGTDAVGSVQKEEIVVVVSHSMVIHAAIGYLMGMDLNDVWHIKAEPGTIVDFDWRYDYAMLQGLSGPFNVREVK